MEQKKPSDYSTRLAAVPHFLHRRSAFRRRGKFLKSVKGTLRHRAFRWVVARRCLGCSKPIIFTLVMGEPPRLTAVDAPSWDGSSFYLRGIHHRHQCVGFMKAMKRWKEFRASDLYVEDPT